MHGKGGFKLHAQVQHLAVVMLVPHRRLNLSPALLPKPLQASSQQILARLLDLFSAVQTILLERLPPLTSTPS